MTRFYKFTISINIGSFPNLKSQYPPIVTIGGYWLFSRGGSRSRFSSETRPRFVISSRTLHLDVSRDEVGRYNILSMFYYVRVYVRYLLMYVFSRQKYPFPARKGPFSPRVSSRKSRLEILISERLILVQSQISRNVRDENETHLYFSAYYYVR
jgi:hypothetical protein